ncbi:hypothetical protein, partial [Nocardia gipuzkoensis]|uniref:hypothetical protein n=1 Tax=Nocardia gipuzkoensis TaxID=2749991 RepID=UPI001C665315
LPTAPVPFPPPSPAAGSLPPIPPTRLPPGRTARLRSGMRLRANWPMRRLISRTLGVGCR